MSWSKWEKPEDFYPDSRSKHPHVYEPHQSFMRSARSHLILTQAHCFQPTVNPLPQILNPVRAFSVILKTELDSSSQTQILTSKCSGRFRHIFVLKTVSTHLDIYFTVKPSSQFKRRLTISHECSWSSKFVWLLYQVHTRDQILLENPFGTIEFLNGSGKGKSRNRVKRELGLCTLLGNFRLVLLISSVWAALSRPSWASSSKIIFFKFRLKAPWKYKHITYI